MEYKIYLIENLVNSKKYVGYTTGTLKRRFYQHSRSNKPIGKAIRLYGKESFTIKIIDEYDVLSDALTAEVKWVAYYDSFTTGYNCTKGGDCSPIRRKQSAYKSKEFSDKVRKNALEQHSNPLKKKTHIEGIRNYWKNLSESERNKRIKNAQENGKLSKVGWNKGLKFPGTGKGGATNPMAKKYRVWFPNGSEVVIDCLSDFCRKNNLTYRNACGVLEGKQTHHKGFRFARMESHT
jgi:group I intron endonuclease